MHYSALMPEAAKPAWTVFTVSGSFTDPESDKIFPETDADRAGTIP